MPSLPTSFRLSAGRGTSILQFLLSRHAIQLLFFLALLGVGLGLHRDYGISFDEQQQRLTGSVSLKHVVELVAPRLVPESVSWLPALRDYPDRDYGVAFELPAAALEFLMGISDSREAFFFRHLLTFLVAFAGIIAVHQMALRRFRDWRMAILTTSFLVLSPRLFAESFYNSKDIVFMAFFAIATCTTITFVLQPSLRTAIVAAFTTALSIDVRMMAVVLPVVAAVTLALRLKRQEVNASQMTSIITAYFSGLCIFTLLLWPWLWSDPLANFGQAFLNMSKFRWEGDSLYLGTFVSSTALPWHYVIVWIGLTTPLLFLGLFLVGAFAILQKAKCRGLKLWKSDDELQDLFFLGLACLPVVAVIALRSVLYDGWRQLYFIYPMLLLVAAGGWWTLWTYTPRRLPRASLLLVTSFSLLSVTWWMWQAHPFQNVYFNALAGRDIGSRFELDYWALSNRQGLEYILKHDLDEVVTVAPASFMPLTTSRAMLDRSNRNRIEVTDQASARYILTNYRHVRDRTTADAILAEHHDRFHEIKVDNQPILIVYRRRN